MDVRFEDCTLHIDKRELRRDSELVALEPQTFDVLTYLVTNRERVVSKEELLDEVWGDQFVSESTLTTRIKQARQAVGDDGRTQRVIKTSHGHGYRFVAPVEVEERDPPATVEAAGGTAAPPLPAPKATTIGRSELLAVLAERVGQGRLVTLVGPAGIGKTHLATTLAADVARDHPGPVWFVELVETRDPAAVADVMLEATGQTRQAGTGAAESLVAAVAGSGAFLVIDNCEHVLPTVRDLVARIRRADRGAAILTTSRQRLGVAEERLIRGATARRVGVGPIAGRPGRRGRHRDRPDPTNVLDLCRRLDHLPLAIRLANPTLAVLGIDPLLAMLDQRLALLEADDPDEVHHRTLQAAILSSYDMLDPGLQQTLCRFSVFAGSFSLESAIAVAAVGGPQATADAAKQLVELVDRSMVTIDRSDDGSTRYRLMESVRLFGTERLEQSTVVRDTHFEHTVAAARQLHERLGRSDYGGPLAEFGSEWANYRVAVSHGLHRGRMDETLALLTAVGPYAEMMQRLEHTDWVRAVLDSNQLDERQRDLANCWVAQVQNMYDRAAGLPFADDVAVRVAGGEEIPPTVVLSAGGTLCLAGDFDRGLPLLEWAGAELSGYQRDYASALGSFHALRGGRDPQPFVDATLGTAGSVDPLGQCLRTLAKLTVAVGTPEGLTLADRLVEQTASGGYLMLQVVAYRLRTVVMAGGDDDVVIDRLIESLERYTELRALTGVLSDSSVAAGIMVRYGLGDEALALVRGHRAAGARGAWSERAMAGVVDALEAELGAEATERKLALPAPEVEEIGSIALGALRSLRAG